jgi:deoxyguanosine kinase
MNDFVAIEGCIGSGKTTLAKLLAEKLNARLLLERFRENAFLESFYEDPKRYAFPTEMSFLADRYQQMSGFFEPDIFQPMVISDYMPYKSLIFAQQNLDNNEFNLYKDFHSLSLAKLVQPDLILHLNRPTNTLLELIKKRGRSFEKGINPDYLNKLKTAYSQAYRSIEGIGRIAVLELADADFVEDIGLIERIADLVLQERSNKTPKIIYYPLNKI